MSDIHIAFCRLTPGEHYRQPGSHLVWIKRSDNLADVHPDLRIHPHAPRCGFCHPPGDMATIAMTPEEVGALLHTPLDAWRAHLRGLEITEDGILWALLDSEDARQNFLHFLSGHLDPQTNRVRLRQRSDGLYGVGFTAHQIRLGLTLLVS